MLTLWFASFLLLLGACVATRPWSLACSVKSDRCYASWPRATGIYQINTKSPNVVTGELTVDTLNTAGSWTVPQTGGVVVVYDDMLDVSLLFAIEISSGQIVRYTLDESSGSVSTLSDRIVILNGLSAPEALTFDNTGETACVTYTQSTDDVRIARCYRISRQQGLSSRTAISEWWTSVGYYPYAGAAQSNLDSAISLSAAAFDGHARMIENAQRSLWIDHSWDLTRRVMTRFPLIIDGSSTPSSTTIYFDGAPSDSTSAQHVVFQLAPEGQLFAVLSEEYSADQLPLIFVTQWTADSEPAIMGKSFDPETLGTSAHKLAAMWLVAELNADQLVDLQLVGNALIVYDRTAQAAQLGYVAASPTPSPSPAAPSASSIPVSPSSSPLPEVINTSPSRFPDAIIPSQSAPPALILNHSLDNSDAASRGNNHKSHNGNYGLLALLAILPLCCCVIIVLAIKKRATVAKPILAASGTTAGWYKSFGSLRASVSEIELQPYEPQDENLIPIGATLRDDVQ